MAILDGFLPLPRRPRPCAGAPHRGGVQQSCPDPGAGRPTRSGPGHGATRRRRRHGRPAICRRPHERVRLLGIDTPETVKPEHAGPVLRPRGIGAHQGAAAAGHARARSTRDVEARDRYGRLLLYVYRAADGMFVNRHLVGEGFARILSIAPNTAHAPSCQRGRAAHDGAGPVVHCAEPRASLSCGAVGSRPGTRGLDSGPGRR